MFGRDKSTTSDKSSNELQAEVSAQPRNPLLRYLLSRKLLSEGQNEMGLVHALQSVELSGDATLSQEKQAGIRENLANAFLNNKMPMAAQTTALEALNAGIDSAHLRVRLAQALSQLGVHEKAIEQANAAINMSPGDSWFEDVRSSITARAA